LLRQLGYQIIPPSLGKEIWIPGPLAGGGILLTPQDTSESKKSLDLVESMLFGLSKYNQQDKESMGKTNTGVKICSGMGHPESGLPMV
jgi:hypothetical protein